MNLTNDVHQDLSRQQGCSMLPSAGIKANTAYTFLPHALDILQRFTNFLGSSLVESVVLSQAAAPMWGGLDPRGIQAGTERKNVLECLMKNF